MSKLEILTKLVAETRKFQLERDTPFTQNGFVGFRNISGYGQALVNSKMKEIISDLSDAFYNKDKFLSRSWTKQDWSKNVERVFMEEYFLKFYDVPSETFIPDLLKELESQLGRNSTFQSVTFAFGCQIFSNYVNEKIDFGRVKFYGRELWLDERLKSGKITNTLYDYLKFEWGFRMGPLIHIADDDEIRLGRDISNFLGHGHYVCEVDVSNLAGDAAEAKAVMAMNFAKTAIGLTWAKPSKALWAMPSIVSGYPRIVYRGSFVDGDYKGNSIRTTGGIGQALIDITWPELEKDYSSIFDIVSEIIEYSLSSTGVVKRPKIMDTFAHAMLWFHEACTEELPMVAITKFVASLDALASASGGAGGIVEVVAARLGVQKSDPIRDGGPSFEEAIRNIYSSGRSRLLHGSSDRLMEDWHGMRALTEELSRLTLLQCLEWAGRNPSNDDPKQMKKET
jgi:hypothetical protein